MKYTQNLKKKYKKQRANHKRKKEQEKRNLEKARKLIKQIPKKVRYTKAQYTSWIVSIISGTIVVIYFICMFIKSFG